MGGVTLLFVLLARLLLEVVSVRLPASPGGAVLHVEGRLEGVAALPAPRFLLRAPPSPQRSWNTETSSHNCDTVRLGRRAEAGVENKFALMFARNQTFTADSTQKIKLFQKI